VICDDAGPQTEWEFFRATRTREPDGCCGPLLKLEISDQQFHRIDEAINDGRARDLLTLQDDESPQPLWFLLCAAHWMDLIYVVGVKAVTQQEAVWFNTATVLLVQVCQAAGWDPKEVANLVKWRILSLT